MLPKLQILRKHNQAAVRTDDAGLRFSAPRFPFNVPLDRDRYPGIDAHTPPLFNAEARTRICNFVDDLARNSLVSLGPKFNHSNSPSGHRNHLVEPPQDSYRRPG